MLICIPLHCITSRRLLINEDNLSYVSYQFEDIKQLTGAPSYEIQPTHIYEVMPNDINDAKFEEFRDSRDLLYAYHLLYVVHPACYTQPMRFMLL